MRIAKLINESNRAAVCRLLGWDMLAYGEFQQAAGLQYISEQVCGDAESVQTVAESPIFWAWWVNHWNRRDAEFLTYAGGYSSESRVLLYENLNNIAGFEFYPHTIILEQAYAQMVGNMIDAERRTA